MKYRNLELRLKRGLIADYLVKLSEAELKVYLIIAAHASWITGIAYPSFNTIKIETGIAKECTISRAIRSLESKKLITIEFRRAKRKDGTEYGRKRYFYTLLDLPGQTYFRSR